MFDFKNDETLKSVLPTAMLEKMNSVQQTRVENGHTSKNGLTYANIERTQFENEVFDWKANGKDSETLKSLKVKEATLRSQGKF